ncbi:hypothetical protein E4U42_005766 [Claviceps africana]|uniref:Zn(2)-C6 fungal-type domain-containing protein n=1 Tax=Claviceps africana TaxID=83212 RepID=A0A8K0J3U8_9HYPO|nr:hypothetical protein E4U42_005766 [Claviceps africana]
MAVGREGEAEDASGLTYPSPGAEPMDSGPFYHSKPEQHGQPEPEVPEESQGQEHEQAQMDTQQISSPQHHISRPANLEELQLAAQLGQGLAGTSIMSATDDASMNVDDPSLRNIMPHSHPHPDPSDQHQPSPYVQEEATADSMVQHQMSVPIEGSVAPQYSMGDDIPPRKRSKVSRACDQCRRKKIKCDAQSDTGESPCSSCARANTPCLFSRVPQKRGPSKGYIKELADRIHSIENKLESDGNISQDDIEKLFVTDRSRHSIGVEDASRKRPFSSISTRELAANMTIRQAPWGSEPRSSHAILAAEDSLGHEYGNASLAPPATPITADEVPPRQAADHPNVGMEDAHEVLDIDEEAYQHFLVSVQPVYPILPYEKSKLQSLLSAASPAVRTAFAHTLPHVGQTCIGDTKLASSILHEWENSDAPRSRATDIVHAQTLLMLIIDADWRASSTLPFLLARGVALANTMKLWKPSTVDVGSDHDADEQICVRIWWSLVLMDRWHAAGTGHPPQVPERSTVIPSGLENQVGEVCFYLVRLSKLLNRISFVISTLQAGATAADHPMAAILTDYIENYREDLPAHVDAAAYPMIHLAYWHCRLLVTLLTPGITPKEIMWPTKELAHLLSVSAEMKSPLINHFVSLATMALGELIKADVTREEIADIIRDVVGKPSGGHWDSVREKLTETLRTTTGSVGGVGPDTAASQGLQHLADLATAHEGGAADEAPLGTTLAAGYLEAAS